MPNNKKRIRKIANPSVNLNREGNPMYCHDIAPAGQGATLPILPR